MSSGTPWHIRVAKRSAPTPPFDPPSNTHSFDFDDKKKKCLNCERQIDIDSSFCKFCGKDQKGELAGLEGLFK